MRPDVLGSSARVTLYGALRASAKAQLSPPSALRMMCAISVMATALPGDAGSYSTHHAGVAVPKGGTYTTFQVSPPLVDSFTPTLVDASTRPGLVGITE